MNTEFAAFKKSFKPGALYRASGCKPNTVRVWITGLGLKLGEGSGTGHSRYSIADALAVAIMAELTFGQRIVAARAAAIVNDVRAQLDGVISDYESERRERRKWRWHGGPYLIVGADQVHADDDDHSMRAGLAELRVMIAADGTLSAMIDGMERRFSCLVVPLPKLINKVTLALENIFTGMDRLGAAEAELVD